MHIRIGFTVEIHLDFNARFFGFALDTRSARHVDQRVRDVGPLDAIAELRRLEFESADIQIGRELDIGLAVAHHRRARPVDAAIAQHRLHQAERGFAVRRVFIGKTAVDQRLAKADALALENLHHQRMRTVEAVLRERVGAQTILIGHHHEVVAGVAQTQHRRDHAIDQRQLVISIDLEIRRLANQGAVAVDEQNGLDRTHAAACCDCSAANTASFSSGRPTVIRSASPSPGVARISRTTTPAANKRR